MKTTNVPSLLSPVEKHLLYCKMFGMTFNFKDRIIAYLESVQTPNAKIEKIEKFYEEFTTDLWKYCNDIKP